MAQDEGSVTRLVNQLKSGNRWTFEGAAADVWRKYSPKLMRLVHRRLNRKLRVRTAPDDVLQSAFRTFYRRQNAGEYEIKDRDDLWKLLVTITLNKSRNAANHHGCQSRDYRREYAQSGSLRGREAVEEATATSPNPVEWAIARDEFDLCIKRLPEDLRSVALLALAGYTNKEMASPERLDCAVRTIERRLNRLRAILSREVKRKVSDGAG